MDFIAAAANLRSVVYGIRLVDRLEAQQVSGKIIPALATTTSIVAGLVSLELLKIASERVRLRKMSASVSDNDDDDTTSATHRSDSQLLRLINTESEKDKFVSRFRNAFVNVARPLLAYSQPVLAESYTTGGHSFTVWDVIEVSVYIYMYICLVFIHILTVSMLLLYLIHHSDYFIMYTCCYYYDP